MNAPSPTMVPDNFEEIKWTELEKSLSDLRLKWITIGDYVVVVNNKCDVTIGGEPYLALQVWFNVKSGKMIHRIWDQTVSYSKVTGVSQFVEACSSYFKGRPCLGLPLPTHEISWKTYVISQTPMPRKISMTCRKKLEPSTDRTVKSCPDCVMLNDPKNNEIEPYETGACPSQINDTKEENFLTGVAHQAMYLQEISKKYPHILKAGKQFRIKIKTKDAKGCIQEEFLQVDPTQSLQEGGIVKTLTEDDIKGAKNSNNNETEAMEDTNLSKSGQEVLKSDQEFSGTDELYTNAENALEQHDELDSETNEYESDSVKLYDTQTVDMNQKDIDPEVMKDNHTILQDNNSITDVNKFKCNICTYSAKWKGTLERHIWRRHMKKKPGAVKSFKSFTSLKCETCGKIFSSARSLDTHRSMEHAEVKLHKKCDICNKVVTMRLFHKHMLKLHGIKGSYEVPCYWCKKSYSTVTYLDHITRAHLYGMFSCEKCSFVGNVAGDLVNHVNANHERVTSAKCPSCKKDHPIEILEAEYKKCIHNLYYFERMCSDCGKTLKGGKKALGKHKNFHCSERPKQTHFCDKCGKTFTTPKSLRNHIKVAHENFVFQCELCPMTFKNKSQVHSHKLVAHSTDPKYQCKFCGKRSRSLNERKSHERRCGKLEPTFQCSFCEKKLSTPFGLKVHERQHTGEKPFKCTVCEAAFTSLGGLQQHERGVHKMVGPKGALPGWDAYKKPKHEYKYIFHAKK